MDNLYSFQIFFDVLFTQVFVIYVWYKLTLEKNLFKALAGLLISFALLGGYLLIFQIDLSVAFFWVGELTIIFVLILCVLQAHLTSELSNRGRVTFKLNAAIGLFFLSLQYASFINSYDPTPASLDLDLYCFYETPHVTDLYAIFVLLYGVNAFEFLLLMFLILLITLMLIKICVLIHLIKNITGLPAMFDVSVYSYLFKRAQSLIKQNLKKPNFKSFFKKK